MRIWLNGALVDEADARISPSDHGFLVGDGVFETLRWYERVPFALAAHLRRLDDGCRRLGIDAPAASELEAAAHAVIEANDLRDARMRITVTSGSGPAGLLRGEGPPTVLMVALPLAPWPPTSTAAISDLRRDEHSPLAGVKTVSLDESSYALARARATGATRRCCSTTPVTCARLRPRTSSWCSTASPPRRRPAPAASPGSRASTCWHWARRSACCRRATSQ